MKESDGLWVHRFPGEPPPLVALHGFTQTGEMFSELAELLDKEVLAPDLPGHGRSGGVPASFTSAVNGAAEVLDSAGGRVPLVGYSQGGRVALAVALERPELVSHLVLVSASPGIADEVERAARRHADEVLAEELENLDIALFLDWWLAQPLFEGLRRREASWRVADRAARAENTAAGLAAALVGMGQGAQPYFGESLPELRIPVLVVAGELDEKYGSMARAMFALLPHGELRIIPGAGHAVIAEEARAVADLVAGFLAGAS